MVSIHLVESQQQGRESNCMQHSTEAGIQRLTDGFGEFQRTLSSFPIFHKRFYVGTGSIAL